MSRRRKWAIFAGGMLVTTQALVTACGGQIDPDTLDRGKGGVGVGDDDSLDGTVPQPSAPSASPATPPSASLPDTCATGCIAGNPPAP
jgi:hypothetical protein